MMNRAVYKVGKDSIRQNYSFLLAHPEGEKDIYASWQRMQYLHSMFSAHHHHLDNIRYPGISWADAKEILTSVKG